MTEKFSLVPDPMDQEWLLDGLRDLAALQGVERLLTTTILEPSRTFFPDLWTPDADGVLTLTRRILRYAGLSHLRVALWVDAYATRVGAIDPLNDRSHGREGTAAWFAGIVDGTCLFGLDEARLDDAESVAGVLAHEVAHAWREHHAARVNDRAVEEELTDLTTIYLGFGVLTTNNTLRHRSRGVMRGGAVYHEWSRSQAGYLPPQAMSFLLAAQCIARGMSASDRRALKRHLEPTQAEAFDAAWEAIHQRHGDLSDRLALPPREAWPEPEDPLQWTGPLEETDSPWADLDVCERPTHRRAVGVVAPPTGAAHCGPLAARAHVLPPAPTAEPEAPPEEYTRPLAPRHVRSWAPFAALAGFGLVFFGVRFVLGDSAPIPWPWLLGGTLVGGVAGRLVRRDQCGAFRCRTPIARDETVCAGCGALVLDADHPWLPPG